MTEGEHTHRYLYKCAIHTGIGVDTAEDAATTAVLSRGTERRPVQSDVLDRNNVTQCQHHIR